VSGYFMDFRRAKVLGMASDGIGWLGEDLGFGEIFGKTGTILAFISEEILNKWH